MEKFAHSFERLNMADVVKEVKLGQEVGKGNDGKICRVYKITLEFEDPKMLKEKLEIEFEKLCETFSKSFVPRLMHETLQLLRKSAESELTGDAGNTTANELKKVIGVTTGLTKVARGTEVIKAGDEEAGEAAVVPESDDDEAQNDEVGETDGDHKKNANKYGSDDEEMANEQSDSEQSVAHGDSESNRDNDETAA